jgi:phage I-like protein
MALCAVLGLAVETKGEEIVEAVRRLVGCAGEGRSPGEDRARYVSMSHYERTATELNTLRAERARERAEHAVTEALRAGKIVPAQREWATEYCSADHDGFQRFVERQPAIALSDLNLARRPARAGLMGHDEAGARGREGAELSAGEIAICAHLGIRPGDYARRKTAPSDLNGSGV